MKCFKYNYVIFNTADSLYKVPSDTDYYSVCMRDLESMPYVQIVPLPMSHMPYLVRLLRALHFSRRVNHYINLPLKSLWYPLMFKSKFSDDKPICFVILNSLDVEYLSYLKRVYKGSKIVLLHRDFISISQHSNPQLPFNPILDLEMTYDEGESQKYGFPHFSEIESKIHVDVAAVFESDVFFFGKAKDRLPEILDAYKVLTDAGLKVYFYLTGVPADMQEPLPGVEYASRFMSYQEVLVHSVNSRCILEIVQGDNQMGYTSRFLEAVIYGKRMITNHSYVKKSKFYDPDKIQFVEKMSDINPSFVRRGNGFVDYNYQGEFSPTHMISRIEEELDNRR